MVRADACDGARKTKHVTAARGRRASVVRASRCSRASRCARCVRGVRARRGAAHSRADWRRDA